MRQLVVLVKVQAIAATGLMAMLAIATPPALAQEAEGGSESAAVEAVVVEEDAELEEEAPPVAISADNPQISTLQLQLLLNPLTAEELEIEADAWLLTLRERIQSISEIELAIEHENEIIAARQEVQKQLEAAKKANAPDTELETFQRALTALNLQESAFKAQPEVKKIFAAAKANYAVIEGKNLIESAQKNLESAEGQPTNQSTLLITDLVEALRKYEFATEKLKKESFFSKEAYEEALKTAEVRKEEVNETFSALQSSPLLANQLTNTSTQEQIRDQLIAQATVLETSRADLVTRVRTVLDEMEKKGGDVESYDRYTGAVTGIDFDVTDTQGIKIRFLTWLQSENGGISLGLGLLKFGGILAAAFIIAPRAGSLSNKLLNRVEGMSVLFREFTVMSIQRAVMVAGGLLALAALGVNLGPILAFIGGASFILGFALQSNLGNFASGLMLLINKPFDVGDEVKVAGYWAYVDSISLASTKLKDFTGNIVTLPNNTVWGGDIINYTHSDIRKMNLGINVKINQDVEQIQTMWLDITSSHPKVLKEPGAGIFPWNSTYSDHIWIGLLAWSKTDAYWEVYVDLLKALQKRLHKENIELAAPIQEIRWNGNDDAIASLPSSNTLPEMAAKGIG